MTINRGLKALSIFVVILMYIVLLQGALVTNSGSADGCGTHWPLCKGTFMPDWDYEAIIEFSHRAVSGLAGLMVIWLAVWSYRVLRSAFVKYLGFASVFTILFQGLLGAGAVVFGQSAPIKALHFGISLLSFSTVLLTAVVLRRADKLNDRPGPPVAPEFLRWTFTVALITYGVVYIGALVRHLGATLSCMGWPLCNGLVIPELYGAVGAAFLHRVGAAVCALLVIRLYVVARRYAADRQAILGAARWANLLMAAQIGSGAILALGHVNLLTQMLHSAIIVAFWGVLCYAAFEAGMDRVRLTEQPTVEPAL